MHWAAQAPRQVLAAMTIGGGATAATLMLADWRRVALAALLITISTVGGWGLLKQGASTPPSRATRVGQAILLALGTIGAVVGGFGVLFWVMGPAPVL